MEEVSEEVSTGITNSLKKHPRASGGVFVCIDFNLLQCFNWGSKSSKGEKMTRVKKAEFYFLNTNRILRAESFSWDYDGHRSTRYIHGPFLRLDEMTVGIDADGHPSYNVGKTPLSEDTKKNIVTKFAKARKKSVAKKFFRMK